jgi:hypothetical protein
MSEEPIEMLVAGEDGELYATVVQFFTDDDWVFYSLEDRPILRMNFRGENGGWQCYAQVREEQKQLIFYSVMESHVPENKRPAVAEFLTRANYGLYVGNFEMDFSDGEVRYKTSVDADGGCLTPQMIRTIVYVNVMMMDKYLPGIMSVVYTDVSPEEAVAQIEG